MIELIDVALQSSDVVLQEARDPEYAEELKMGMVAIAVGLSALAAGYAERGIGAAAVGAMAETSKLSPRWTSPTNSGVSSAYS